MSRDAGAETATNYRFQYLYATLLIMQMYNKKNNFLEIVCERDNDITAKDKTGRLTSYQITRSNTINSIPDNKVIHSLHDFLDLCKDKNKKYSNFCLVSNQKISNITTKTNEQKFLNGRQIERYAKKLCVDFNEKQNQECLGKIGFMVIQDSLGLEYLIDKEILAFDRDISNAKLNCIKERVVNLVERCSRSSYKEDSRYYTRVEEKRRHTKH